MALGGDGDRGAMDREGRELRAPFDTREFAFMQLARVVRQQTSHAKRVFISSASTDARHSDVAVMDLLSPKRSTRLTRFALG